MRPRQFCQFSRCPPQPRKFPPHSIFPELRLRRHASQVSRMTHMRTRSPAPTRPTTTRITTTSTRDTAITRDATPSMEVLDRGVEDTLSHRFRGGNMASITRLLTRFAQRHNLPVWDERTVLRFLQRQRSKTIGKSLGGVLTYAKRLRARLKERKLDVTLVDQYKQALVSLGANVADRQAHPATLEDLRFLQKTWPTSMFAMVVLASLDGDRFTEMTRLSGSQLVWHPTDPNRMAIRWLDASKMGPADPYNLSNFSVVTWPPSLRLVRDYLVRRSAHPKVFEHTGPQVYSTLKACPRTKRLGLRSFRRLAANLGVSVTKGADLPPHAYGAFMHHRSKALPSASCRYPSEVFDLVDMGKASAVASRVMAQL